MIGSFSISDTSAWKVSSRGESEETVEVTRDIPDPAPVVAEVFPPGDVVAVAPHFSTENVAGIDQDIVRQCPGAIHLDAPFGSCESPIDPNPGVPACCLKEVGAEILRRRLTCGREDGAGKLDFIHGAS